MSEFTVVLPEIIKGLKSTYGDDFFNQMTSQLNKFINADKATISSIASTLKWTTVLIGLFATLTTGLLLFVKIKKRWLRYLRQPQGRAQLFRRL